MALHQPTDVQVELVYALDNTPDSEVWMQHRYLFDAEELRSRPRWKAAAKVGTTSGDHGEAPTVDADWRVSRAVSTQVNNTHAG